MKTASRTNKLFDKAAILNLLLSARSVTGTKAVTQIMPVATFGYVIPSIIELIEAIEIKTSATTIEWLRKSLF